MPTTRKQRISAAPDIPLAQPDRSGPKAKTLFEIAEERQAELQARADALNAARSGGAAGNSNSSSSNGSRSSRKGVSHSVQTALADVADESPLLNALLYATSLTAFHFTLDVLVFHQYGQEILWSFILERLPLTFVALLLTIYLFHTATASKFAGLRQAVFAAASVAIGCHMVYVANKEPYLAVMVRAPPLGVAWVWCVVEMRWEVALASLVCVAAWGIRQGLGFW